MSRFHSRNSSYTSSPGIFPLVFSVIAGLALLWTACSEPTQAQGSGRGARIVKGARVAAGLTGFKVVRPFYDPKYVRLKYPGGDPGKRIGVCTDIVVRAYRHIGVDLQVLLYRDMKRNFKRYRTRRIYRQTRPNRNIDHRRVNNLVDFFRRHGKRLPRSIRGKHLRTWKPGDIVVFDLRENGTMTHIGIVSNKKSSSGVPLVIHHLPVYPREDNALVELKIIGHYRY